jgi:predicted NAD/FAD-binding protein
MGQERIAIIGTGIAGLGCAYLLRSRYELTLFEQADYLGGHTNTVDVTHRGESVAFDTGFMVFNRVTYPNLCRFFSELGVPSNPTDMSFSVQHRPSGLEYCGAGLNGLFAQRSNLLRPRHWRMLLQMDRFSREAIQELQSESSSELTVAEYVQQRGYGSDFLNRFLIPISGAVWSTPRDRMLEFPARTLLRFFYNHGFLGLKGRHPWWTVTGGAREYVRRLTPLLAGRIHLQSRVTRVSSGPAEATVTLDDGTTQRFDKVILACHADQALRLLSEPPPLAAELLGEFKYQPNLATVHTDESVMPRCRRAWSSWNYRIPLERESSADSQTIYWMNSLQGVSNKANYFVSINAVDSVARETILREIPYEHPLFNLGAIRAQRDLPQLNQLGHQTRLFFAGSYFRYGFHEDAFTAALDCCRALTREPLWDSTPAKNES